mgnify:CR=1 FL=1
MTGTIVDLDREDIKRGLAAGAMVLVDVREPHEYAAGHIPGSILMPLSTFDPADLEPYLGERVVFTCRSGGRTQRAIAMAQAAGLALNEHYRGSFLDWQAAGEPIERG